VIRALVAVGALLVAGSLSAEAQDPRMVEIVELIHAGKQADAVSRADVMIAGFAEAQHEPGVSYYCNRDRGGVANLLGAMEKGAKVDLAPEAWCEALFAKAFALTDLKRYDEAATTMAKATAMDPSNPHFRNQYGDVLRLSGRYPDAAKQYGTALRLATAEEAKAKADGGDTAAVSAMGNRALRGLAQASAARGDLAGAQDYYAKALDRDSGDSEARKGLAGLLTQKAGKP
jgi:tetratricopeptide (TPR) repeat protein